MKVGKSVRLYADKYLDNIGSMFGTLYRDELLTDCILHCKDGAAKAHKLILAASSPYFRKIFLEHEEKQTAFIMYGVSVGPLKELLELIYKGSIDIPGDSLNSVFDLAEELQVKGILADDGSTDYKYNGCGRDTRYKGQKRVAVSFVADENESTPAKVNRNSTERRSSCNSEILPKREHNLTGSPNDESSDSLDESKITPKVKMGGDIQFMGHPVDGPSSLSVWARKERKFQCDLCPSSFKRASHLNRHQLVHTGERPFACDQCDKAFSRHDKLKHHVHKSHELPLLNDALPPDSLYTIDHVQILTPEQTMVESPEPIMQSPQPILHKKGRRGRPRKYPIVPPPLVKRPRGRPRLNPFVPQDSPKPQNFDLTNTPDLPSTSYADVDYVTKSNEIGEQLLGDQGIMEPLVEIKTESVEQHHEEKVQETQTTSTFLENIGLLENTAIAKIGECTISVANNGNNSIAPNPVND